MSIANCLEYSADNKCTKCAFFLNLNTTTNQCECEHNTGTVCPLNQSCATEIKKCVPLNECLSTLHCIACKYFNHSECYKCAEGYYPSLTEKACISLKPCQRIRKCKACSDITPAQCGICQSNLNPSSDGMICECVAESRAECPSGSTCSALTRTCQTNNSCLSTINNCKICDYNNHQNCYACASGFYLTKAGACQSTSTCSTLTSCNACDETDNTKCAKCSDGLILNIAKTVCECALGSNLPCQSGYQCTPYTHICAQKNACLTYPVMISSCRSCYRSDGRLCYACDTGYTISPTKLQCVANFSCLTIFGCNTCNPSQPNLCLQCVEGLSIYKDGSLCVCGSNNKPCEQGYVCNDDQCQLSLVKASNSAVIGCSIAIAILLAVIVVLVVFLVRKMSVKAPTVVRDFHGIQ
ncbi:Cysteine-rich membrane protein 2 [Spironucleus salmonicida]|uniref:Cysteine-rich membrane protein 2 n=1 Tax=Spironucleus salmonicida TaxID=348837 RepID=V6LMS5_9EUKA|nr:Cysteine-rich membrane protein 2 [Spironucleus salmonicida]|eukprot:EST45518.1 Cysteine-rich membrane protein 2 [Spironucleus salmonicida]